MSKPKVSFIHMNLDDENDTEWDPDGKFAAAFSAVIDKLGGNIENWEGEWLEIMIPEDKTQDMLNHLHNIENGKYGPDAKMVADKYSVTEIYDDDGDGNPNNDVTGNYQI